jgi:hypothetical protein
MFRGTVRQVSPGGVDLSELKLCVAMIGIRLGWRDRLKNLLGFPDKR